MRRKVIAGNWKMNMTPSQAVKLVTELRPNVNNPDVDVVFCVPSIDIVPVVEAVKGSNIHIGAENVYYQEKGAFTGAIGERKGYFGEADGGTIFLDEVGELPLPTQARLLRVLESGEFIKVGSSKVQKTDVRIVAATNVNLTQAIAEGRFREDLYYRLNTVPIQIPPLRERGDDVLLLFRKFAADFAEKYRICLLYTSDAADEL